MDLSCVNDAKGVHYDCSSLHVDDFDVAIPYIFMHKPKIKTRPSLFLAIQNKRSSTSEDAPTRGKEVWHVIFNPRTTQLLK
jgi:hypothetical protein